jgi:hypothetical protein
VNLIITPAFHRFVGVMAGLLAQPLALTMSAIAFAGHPTLALEGVAHHGNYPMLCLMSMLY